MSAFDLNHIARSLIAPGKGILAMDESTPTCGKRLATVGVDNTEDNRRAYREMLLSTEGLSDYISGAILYDETIRMKTSDGTPFPEMMQQRGIIPGIKVDTGAKDLAGHPGEKVTEGLDGLRERLIEYHQMGARFCKWRAVITIAENLPSAGCIQANAHALARYAALCQENELVPIVEPEVLYDGAHSLERCYEVTENTLNALFASLREQRVILEGIILKASMVLAGKQHPQASTVEQVAEATLRCLSNTVPPAVPGVAFLSGGQSDEAATAHLNEMNRISEEKTPWQLTFSYARALQEPAMGTWRGQAGKVAAAQAVLRHRAMCNGAAARGRYNAELENQAA